MDDHILSILRLIRHDAHMVDLYAAGLGKEG
ncbi:hypothetical protein SDC9_197718 [bioreactor metagenome]|uniref:Uncharacterized protein n=1 Tax=bioreactor metagenome TaxID=1076179 RepID=A0A645IGX2_9ZZZZ